MNYSRQREGIMNFLKSRCDHPTAEFIYQAVKSEYPRISLATVYRNLSQAAAAHEILCFPGDDGTIHFDANPQPHYHFVCNHCHGITDVNMTHIPRGTDDMLDDLALRSGAGSIEGHSLIYYGTCPACLAVMKEESNI